MTQRDCIGMLDWGIGGIECYRRLKVAYPQVPFVYCSDTGAVPYGRLRAAELRERVEQVVNLLVDMGATRLVVACNAASTVLGQVRARVPCTGVIEHARESVPPTLRGVLGVIGGARTVRSGLYRRALTRHDLRVRARVAQPLSAHIEAGTASSVEGRRDLARIMAPLSEADGILLACTHYAAIAGAVQALAPRALVLDPVTALVAHVTRSWQLTASPDADRFVTTGDPLAMRASAERAWGVALPACTRVTLPSTAR